MAYPVQYLELDVKFYYIFLGEMASIVVNNKDKKSSTPSFDDNKMYNYTDNISENIIINDTKETNNIEQKAKYPITTDLKNLFRLIEEFHAERIEVEPLLIPFPVDYIPAVGDVDPFIKIPRPDDVSKI